MTHSSRAHEADRHRLLRAMFDLWATAIRSITRCRSTSLLSQQACRREDAITPRLVHAIVAAGHLENKDDGRPMGDPPSR